VAEGDATFGEIVRRQFHGDLVAGENPDTITSEAAGQMGQNHAVMLQLNTEQAAGELFEYGSGYFNAVFFTQRFSLLLFSPIRQPTARRSRPVDGGADGLSRRGHIGGLQALRSLRDFELNASSFIERPIPVALDGAEMDEHVFAALALDEAKTFGCIKPLHCAFFSHAASFSITANFLLALVSIRPTGIPKRPGTTHLSDPEKPDTGGYGGYYSRLADPLCVDTYRARARPQASY